MPVASDPHAYDYAIVRVVPRVDRGERINAGIIVSCATQRYLAATIAFDAARLVALDATVDPGEVEAALATIPLIAAGDVRGGPIALLPRGERFHWLVAPHSAMIQTSRVHSGLGDDLDAARAQLVKRLVDPLPTRPR